MDSRYETSPDKARENPGDRSNGARVWRVFYTLPRAEKKCEERIRRQGIDVFLPICIVIRQWKDRKKKVVEPLFRSYIFARVDEQERLQVLRTDGVARCVSFGGVLAEVDPGEIEQLKIAQQDPARLSLAAYTRPGIGEEVAVVEGPLQGLRGEVTEHRGDFYLVLRIAAIRQAVRVNLPASWVREVSG